MDKSRNVLSKDPNPRNKDSMSQMGAPLTDFSEDMLNLESFADELTSLVVSPLPHPTNEHSKVIALDSGWGTGKTSLINMWMEKLKLEDPESPEFKFVCLKYNAWENDDFPDALVPILCNFQQLIDMNPDVKMKLNSMGLLEEAISSVSVAVTLFDILPVNVEVEKKSPDTILKAFSERQKHKTLFEDLINSIRGEHDYLIICIDELDRCRPTFAIETLEMVKHFFDLPNVVFVFSLDIEQLSKSIKTVYGDIDSTGYLQRFFDYIYQLPEPKQENLANFLMTRVGHYLNEQDISVLVHLSKPFRISLRAFNVICVVCNQFKVFTEHNHNFKHRWTQDSLLIYYETYFTLIALKYSNPLWYRSFLQNGTDFDMQTDILPHDAKKLLKELFTSEDNGQSCYTEEIANSKIAEVSREVRVHFFVGDEGLFYPIDGFTIPLYEYIDRNIKDIWNVLSQSKRAYTVMKRSFQKIKKDPMDWGLDTAFVPDGVSLEVTKNVDGTKYNVTVRMIDRKQSIDISVNGECIQYLTYDDIDIIAEKYSNEVVHEVTRKLSNDIEEAIRTYQDLTKRRTKADEFFKRNLQTEDEKRKGLTAIYGGSGGIFTSEDISWICKLSQSLVLSMQNLKETCVEYNLFKIHGENYCNNWKFCRTYVTLIAMSHSQFEDKYISLISNGTKIDDEQNNTLRELYEEVFGYYDEDSSLRSCYTEEIAHGDWYTCGSWVISAPDNMNKKTLIKEVKSHFGFEAGGIHAHYVPKLIPFDQGIHNILTQLRIEAKQENNLVRMRIKKV